MLSVDGGCNLESVIRIKILCGSSVKRVVKYVKFINDVFLYEVRFVVII